MPDLFNFVDLVCVGQNLGLEGLVFLQFLDLILYVCDILEIVFIRHLQFVIDQSLSLTVKKITKT